MEDPCVFKISPLTTPALELYLAERGYEEQHRVDNMVLDLASFGDAPLPDPALPLITGDRVDDEWLEGLFELKDVTNADHRRVVPSMYAAIPKDEITVKVLDHEGHIAGTGLGILDRGYVGVYAIHVREDCRRQGLAEAIVRTILTEGAKQELPRRTCRSCRRTSPRGGSTRSSGSRPNTSAGSGSKRPSEPTSCGDLCYNRHRYCYFLVTLY